ncbi:SH2 domain-containing protein A-like isoform X2 [Benincasa hispida]|uniref:SH2 domain-containing protein A-like isoform X2 n=1 Tax=Benincasa hispida TaxID=102211 RepID=UPI0019019CBA|nr:SH2 domain-containing protein A-like isoform X2 [Benincasa hispida]
MGSEVNESEEYSLLKNLRLEIDVDDGCFTVCFWVYLMNSTTFPISILQQEQLDSSGMTPFLILSERNRLKIMPLNTLHKADEDSSPGSSSSGDVVPHEYLDIDFPMEKWVHIGCEVSTDFVRLHIDGKMVGEKAISSSLSEDTLPRGLRRIILGNNGEDNSMQGYVHNAKILPSVSSIRDHYAEDLPVKLFIDNSSTMEIEEGSDGIWNIVGGKPSCRRNFSLDVMLLDSSGHPVLKELEVVASLIYAESGEAVEKSCDEEAPLLASYDGVEFASSDRPSKLLHGRASFKLKISQLSSKCDNKLFRIRFCIPRVEGYPFFEALSSPIRCISRSRNTRMSTLMLKRSTFHPLDGSRSSGLDNGTSEHEYVSVDEEKPSPLLKRIKLGQDKPTPNDDPSSGQADEECNSHSFTANGAENGFGTSLTGRPKNNGSTGASPSDSGSTEARHSALNRTTTNENPISDVNIFKYCLAGLSERSLLLKEIATSVSQEEILEFAEHVSLYSGCVHHRHQILMSKKLIEEGTQAWSSISQNKHHVHWENVGFEIEEQFMRIAGCSSRSLTQQDFELLRRISGCQEYLAQENFERMWCWLYPVAFTLSRQWINAMWSSLSPKWIEGFITKEEAELSLQSPTGLQDPGTFILRFPTSRSWPHPDAGSLVVTYVGNDYALHHRLLTLDRIFSSAEGEKSMRSLQDMLLAEPELSRLGRTIRSH